MNNGGPAFPVSTRPMDTEEGYGHQDGATTWQYGGITVRDYFAAKILPALYADARVGRDWQNYVAQEAYRMADAMLKERETTK